MIYMGRSLNPLLHFNDDVTVTCNDVGETGASWSAGQVGPIAISLN